MANIKKITLVNAEGEEQVFSIFDEGALRLNSDKILVTGNTIVDEVILKGHFKISKIDDVPVGTAIDNVMVAYNVGTAESPVYEVRKRSKDALLNDIGGTSYSMDESTGTLKLQVGKQS